mmetsp:Transcript_9084/g.15148  ORF Transcript_9084/g.15148 Transcript_9084/m.15148 type:complete len:87 (-) Transcript_9084:224-484(-)|eukprot:CAMPEP_0119019004 /NCGR_PEP_ID=MMETSP1176-20130426/20760_1 /TAXON_ID=265551 /ORGANISM="Synedropsis recta cf, Strain CCMP1620" /LENGTH=86 /DNA_ID=CAMNT_0006973123 /DNA_START=81 /DNA_END=341 /DNA_ORIENTATION=-
MNNSAPNIYIGNNRPLDNVHIDVDGNEEQPETTTTGGSDLCATVFCHTLVILFNLGLAYLLIFLDPYYVALFATSAPSPAPSFVAL